MLLIYAMEISSSYNETIISQNWVLCIKYHGVVTAVRACTEGREYETQLLIVPVL